MEERGRGEEEGEEETEVVGKGKKVVRRAVGGILNESGNEIAKLRLRGSRWTFVVGM